MSPPVNKPSGPSVLQKATYIRLSFKKGGQQEVQCVGTRRHPWNIIPHRTEIYSAAFCVPGGSDKGVDNLDKKVQIMTLIYLQ